MSAAAPSTDAAAAAPKGKSRKVLIIAIAAVLVLVLGGGAAAVLLLKKKPADAEAAADGEDGEQARPQAHAAVPPKHDSHNPPIFLPLDPFVVNLADRDSDRFAQIGVTLEVDDAKFAEQMKLYMPAIRNGILMVLAHKTSQQLLERAGKDALAQEIMREAVRPMGIEIEADDDDDESAAAADSDAPKAKKKKRKKRAPVYNPVRSVNFSNFIIQ